MSSFAPIRLSANLTNRVGYSGSGRPISVVWSAKFRPQQITLCGLTTNGATAASSSIGSS